MGGADKKTLSKGHERMGAVQEDREFSSSSSGREKRSREGHVRRHAHTIDSSLKDRKAKKNRRRTAVEERKKQARGTHSAAASCMRLKRDQRKKKKKGATSADGHRGSTIGSKKISGTDEFAKASWEDL